MLNLTKINHVFAFIGHTQYYPSACIIYSLHEIVWLTLRQVNQNNHLLFWLKAKIKEKREAIFRLKKYEHW